MSTKTLEQPADDSMEWQLLEGDLPDDDMISFNSEEIDRLLATPPPPDPAPQEVNIFDLVDARWNAEALNQITEGLNRWDGVRGKPFNSFDEFSQRTLPDLDHKIEGWSPLGMQSPYAATAIRTEAEEWLRRLRSGERPVWVQPHHPKSEWHAVRYVTTPELRDGRWPTLYEIISKDEERGLIKLEAIDPLVYGKGMDIIRFLELDEDAVDLFSQRRGVTMSHTAIGDELWIYEITPSPRLWDAPVIEEAIEEAIWMSTTDRPPKDWWTGFRVADFVHIETTQTLERLARISRSGMTVEGEERNKKIPVPTSMRTKEGFVNLSFRRNQGSRKYFSAGPVNNRAKHILYSLMETSATPRMQWGLQPMRVESLGEEMEELIRQRMESHTSGLPLRDGRWKDVLRLITLGSTGLRRENRRHYDFQKKEVWMSLTEGGAEDRLLYRATMEGRTKENGWAEGAIVKVWPDGGQLSTTRIQRSTMDEVGQTVHVILTPDELSPTIGDQWVHGWLQLDESSANHNPAQELVIHGVSIPTGSRGEKILKTIYDATLAAGEEGWEMPSLSPNSQVNGITGGIDWDRQQTAFISYSAQDYPLIYLDAAPGSGKTSAIAAAVDNTVQNHLEDALVLVVAATNSAVAVVTRKIEEIGTSATRVIRFVAKEGEETRSDITEIICRAAGDLHAPKTLRDRADKLRGCLQEMRKLREAKPNPSTRSSQDIVRYSQLDGEVRSIKSKCTTAVLAYRQPRVVTLTIDSLLARMRSTSRDPLKEFIESKDRLTVFIDEASQVPESAMVSLTEIFPAAYQRYAGDPNQLQPHCRLHRQDFDREYGAQGMALTLQRSAQCPRITLRECRRMSTGIGAIASRLFYGDQLRCRDSDNPNSLFPEYFKDTVPVTLVDVQGKEKTAPSGSKYNLEEQQLAQEIAQNISERAGTEAVLLICFYKEQADQMRRRLPSYRVATADSAQGTEAVYVIILTTRTEETPDFIGEPHRLNVAITRAKEGLIILGCIRTLEESEGNWKRIVQYGRKKGRLVYPGGRI